MALLFAAACGDGAGSESGSETPIAASVLGIDREIYRDKVHGAWAVIMVANHTGLPVEGIWLDEPGPGVTAHAIAGHRWLKDSVTLQNAEDVRRLDRRIRSDQADLSRLLLRLEVQGMLTLAEHDLFEQLIAETGLNAALAHLDLKHGRLIIRPSEDELDALTQDRVVQDAILRLRLIAEDKEHPERPAAIRAIRHLQLACHRHRQEAAA